MQALLDAWVACAAIVSKTDLSHFLWAIQGSALECRSGDQKERRLRSLTPHAVYQISGVCHSPRTHTPSLANLCTRYH